MKRVKNALKLPDGAEQDDRPEVIDFLSRLKEKMPELERLLQECSDHWGYEDPIYRFYHQSWKLYALQDRTTEIVSILQSLLPEVPLNEWFLQIVHDGTGKEFSMSDNDNWLPVTRPILEAFFHARYFLEMAVKYGRELEYPPKSLPSGWASLRYLYGLR